MADSVFAQVISKDRNVNSASYVLFHQLADGAGNVATITAGKLDTNATVVLETAIADDAPFIIGVSKVNAQGFLVDEVTPDSADEGDIALARMTADRKQLGVIVDATTDANRLAINVTGEAQVDLAAHAITNANALPISATNAANASSNPLFVQAVSGIITGEVHDYNTAAAVAGDATSNHDYTVVTAMLVKSIIVSGSGRMKAEVQVGPILSLATKAVFFTDEDGFGQVNFDPAIEVPVTGTGTVRIIRTNREGAATDLYSTIVGIDA